MEHSTHLKYVTSDVTFYQQSASYCAFLDDRNPRIFALYEICTWCGILLFVF